MRFALLVLLAAASTAQAQAFHCAPTLNRVLVRNGETWKEISAKPAEKSTIRELRPEEQRGANKTWGVFLNGEETAMTVCSKYDTVITCGVPGNTLDFNIRTGRYVRTFFASFLRRDSSEIFLEAGRCAADPD
jgi:hypothetical protein